MGVPRRARQNLKQQCWRVARRGATNDNQGAMGLCVAQPFPTSQKPPRPNLAGAPLLSPNISDNSPLALAHAFFGARHRGVFHPARQSRRWNCGCRQGKPGGLLYQRRDCVSSPDAATKQGPSKPARPALAKEPHFVSATASNRRASRRAQRHSSKVPN